MSPQENAATNEPKASTSTQPGVEEPSEWQTQYQGLNARLGGLRARGLWADCELAVGGAGVRVSAHRVLLASASPVLAAMLYGPMATSDSDHLITLPDIEPDIFEIVLEYIYTDNISINSWEVACNLYRAAHFFILPQLQDTCKTYLLNNVIPGCVLHVYEFAQMFDENEIIEKCFKVMGDETEEVLQDQSFVKARSETLAKLFSLPSLNLCSELELFKAAERWVNANAPPEDQMKLTDQEPGDDGNAIKTEREDGNNNVKTLIRSAIKEIRFLTVHQEEFAEYDMTSLLSESESLAIALRLISKKTYMKMPEGFSDSWEKRCQKTYLIKVKVQDLQKDEFNINIQPSCVPKFTWKLNFKKYNIRNKLSISVEARPTDLEKMFDPWICHATVNVKIPSDKDTSQYNWRVTHLFCSANYFDRTRTHKKLFPPHYISLEDIVNPENGYVHDGDTVTVEVKIDAQLPVFG